MNTKTRNIIGWVLTGLIAAFLLFSASGKFISNPQTEAMLTGLGLTADKAHLIGALEILSVILFVIPRTGVLGAMLLSAYLGGAIATHLEHAQAGPPTAAIIVEVVVFITAAIRFPELTRRLMGNS